MAEKLYRPVVIIKEDGFIDPGLAVREISYSSLLAKGDIVFFALVVPYVI